MRRKTSAAMLLCALSLHFVAGDALSQTNAEGAAEPSEGDVRKATELYAKGKNLLESGQTTEALEALEQSYATVPSPNSSLLIARCLRDMERTEAALRRYEQTENEAKAKIDAGEAKYKPTADAAAAERKDLLSKVGTIKVQVKNAPKSTDIVLNGAAEPLPADGQLSLRALPGDTRVQIRPFGKEPLTRTVNVKTGADSELDIDMAATPSSGASMLSHRKWMLPAAIGAGGVGVVGMGLFVGFGVSSQATYDELRRKCGFSCRGRRSEVESGATQQTVANVGLALGLVGLAAGGTLFALWYTGNKHKNSSDSGGRESTPIGLSVGPQKVMLQGSF